MGRAANEPHCHKGQPANECLGLCRLWGLEFQHTARAIGPLLPADGSLNIHLHCLVRDGVYRRAPDGSPAFIEAGGLR